MPRHVWDKDDAKEIIQYIADNTHFCERLDQIWKEFLTGVRDEKGLARGMESLTDEAWDYRENARSGAV